MGDGQNSAVDHFQTLSTFSETDLPKFRFYGSLESSFFTGLGLDESSLVWSCDQRDVDETVDMLSSKADGIIIKFPP